MLYRRILLAVWATCWLSSQVGWAADKAAPESAEPPLEFTLDVAGKPTPVALDKPITVEVNGRKVALKLTANPHRQFKLADISFRYPRHHAFEYENDDPGITIWTFDGNDSVIMLFRYAKLLEGQMVNSIAQGMTGQVDAGSVKKKPTTRMLAGKRRSGIRLDVTIAGVPLRWELYELGTKKNVYALMIQDSLEDDGALSEESKDAHQLLEQTLRLHEPKGKKQKKTTSDNSQT